MAEPRRGLGRGLGALIPAADDGPTGDAGATYLEVSPTDIVPNPRQPRQVFDEDAMAELVFSVREIGLLQPVVVRRRSDGAPFELIAGERRWRACQRRRADVTQAELPRVLPEKRVPHVVKDKFDLLSFSSCLVQ